MSPAEFRDLMRAWHPDIWSGCETLSVPDATKLIAKRVGFRPILPFEDLHTLLGELWNFV